MKVWMRGRSAVRSASPARSMSFMRGAGQAADHRVLHHLADLGDGLEVAVGGDREAGLDDVDAHLVEHFGDLQLFLQGHRGAGRLLAVAQGGVENENAVAGIALTRDLVGLPLCIHGIKPLSDRPALAWPRLSRCCCGKIPLSAQQQPDGAQGRIRSSVGRGRAGVAARREEARRKICALACVWL